MVDEGKTMSSSVDRIAIAHGMLVTVPIAAI